MKLTFLGTGAADWPNKPSCEYTDAERRMTAHILDGHIMLDAGPQGFDHAEALGYDMSLITDVFVSHTHGDHFSEGDFEKFINAANGKINIWCEAGAAKNLRLTAELLSRVEVHIVPVFEPFAAAGYTVTAMPANHQVTGEQPIHYVFEKDGKSLFYGLDGGWFMADTWEYMRKKWRTDNALDALVLDATVGDKDGDFRLGTHNSVPMLRLIVAALKENLMVKENTKIYASHLSRTLYDTDLVKVTEMFAEFGMILANDGLVAEI